MQDGRRRRSGAASTDDNEAYGNLDKQDTLIFNRRSNILAFRKISVKKSNIGRMSCITGRGFQIEFLEKDQLNC